MTREDFVWWEIRFIVGMPILALLAECAGMAIPPFGIYYHVAFFYVSFGWVRFLERVLPAMQVDWFSVGVAAACLLGVTIGLHSFGGWLYREIATRLTIGDGNKDYADPDDAAPRIPQWRLRTTLCLVGVFMLMFVAGTAAVGALHQVAWAPYTR